MGKLSKGRTEAKSLSCVVSKNVSNVNYAKGNRPHKNTCFFTPNTMQFLANAQLLIYSPHCNLCYISVYCSTSGPLVTVDDTLLREKPVFIEIAYKFITSHYLTMKSNITEEFSKYNNNK